HGGLCFRALHKSAIGDVVEKEFGIAIRVSDGGDQVSRRYESQSQPIIAYCGFTIIICEERQYGLCYSTSTWRGNAAGWGICDTDERSPGKILQRQISSACQVNIRHRRQPIDPNLFVTVRLQSALSPIEVCGVRCIRTEDDHVFALTT